LALRILAVDLIVMVTGSGPHEKVMIPPAATAATTASEVQLFGVPSPMTRVGWAVSTARASTGTVACPFGLPGAGKRAAAGGDAGPMPDAAVTSALAPSDGFAAGAPEGWAEPHADMTAQATSRTTGYRGRTG
jgi:hypothetical protein